MADNIETDKMALIRDNMVRIVSAAAMDAFADMLAIVTEYVVEQFNTDVAPASMNGDGKHTKS